MAWSAQPVRHHLLHIATDDTRLLACLRLLRIVLREVLPETQLAVPTVARLSCLGRFVVGLAPPCSRRLGRGWDSTEERNHTKYEGVGKNMATACHLCNFQDEVELRGVVSAQSLLLFEHSSQLCVPSDTGSYKQVCTTRITNASQVTANDG